jgi:hypothetical protein
LVHIFSFFPTFHAGNANPGPENAENIDPKPSPKKSGKKHSKDEDDIKDKPKQGKKSFSAPNLF